jgi:hypothetical protein
MLQTERGSVKYNNCATSDIKYNFTAQYRISNKIKIKKKEFLLRVVAKHGLGKNSMA